MKRFLSPLLTTILALGCASPSPVRPHAAATMGNPRVIVEVLDPSLDQFAPLWEREIARRFDNAVAIFVHGGDFVEGEWIVGTSYAPMRHVTPIRQIVERYRRLYPNRTVVVLACNTGHLPIGIPGVYYARSLVWCVPDRELTHEMFQSAIAGRKFLNGAAVNRKFADGMTRWQADPDAVGNIFEFVAD